MDGILLTKSIFSRVANIFKVHQCRELCNKDQVELPERRQFQRMLPFGSFLTRILKAPYDLLQVILLPRELADLSPMVAVIFPDNRIYHDRCSGDRDLGDLEYGIACTLIIRGLSGKKHWKNKTRVFYRVRMSKT